MGKFINGLGACRKSAHFQYSGHLSGPRQIAQVQIWYRGAIQKITISFFKKMRTKIGLLICKQMKMKPRVNENLHS